jgi:hypothetical protein
MDDMKHVEYYNSCTHQNVLYSAGKHGLHKGAGGEVVYQVQQVLAHNGRVYLIANLYKQYAGGVPFKYTTDGLMYTEPQQKALDLILLPLNNDDHHRPFVATGIDDGKKIALIAEV